MSLNAKNVPSSGGGNRVEQPEMEDGVYPARIVQILDLGLQKLKAFEGKEKEPSYRISLTYELVDVFMVDEDGNEIENKPRWVSETINFKPLTADLATSTKRYNALDPKHVYDGDFTKLIGMPCNVSIAINRKGDKVYTNVTNVAAMRSRDADKCPELQNEARVFALDDPDMEVFGNLPQWLQDLIKQNLNFEGSELQKRLAGGGAEKPKDKPKRQAKPKAEEEDKPDDPPFDADEDDSPY